jgi:hypothetical protein
MRLWLGIWMLLAGFFPCQAQEWRPVPDVKGQPGITLGKPRVKTTVSPVSAIQLPLPSETALYHSARHPGDLGKLSEPTFPPSSPNYHKTFQPPVGAEEAFNCGVVGGPAPAPYGAPGHGGHPFFQGVKDCWNRLWNPTPSPGHPLGGWDARSDQCFKDFISPISNPAYFEDPRSLTEIRPILMYRKAPDDSPLMRGGNLFVFNLQGRISINDRWSIVLHRLGFASVNPGDGTIDGFDGGTGLTDLQIGTKYTFYRDDRTNTLAAAGVSFEIPIGSDSVLSGTGAGVTPYLSFGQGWGDFHFLATAGYRFGFNDSTSDFFFTSLHLDYGFFKRIYPLVEVNWYHYTSNGTSRNVDFEGTDLFNLGATDVEGKNFVTLALGLRLKLTEGLQTGIAYETALTGNNGLDRYRIIFDLIFRY